MCRLFISLNTKNSIDELNKFYNHRETKQMVHGFGIGKHTHNKWKFEKDINPLYKSPLYNEFVDKTNYGLIFAHARQIYVKELSNDEIDKYYTIHNTHPFQYKNFWMAHHGNLFLEQNSIMQRFQSNIDSLLFITAVNDIRAKHINKSFYNKILGNTDTELMFYLFLSLYNKQLNVLSQRSKMINSFKEMIQLISQNGFINISNILIADENYIIIANIDISNTDNPLTMIEPVRLYLNNLSFCSTKLDKTYSIVQENTFFVYNIKTRNIKSYSI